MTTMAAVASMIVDTNLRSSIENLNTGVEKKLDAALVGDKKKKKDAGNNGKKNEKVGAVGPGKGKTKGKLGKGKKTVIQDSDANNTSQLNSDAVTDQIEDKDDTGQEKKGSEKNKDLEQFEEEDVDWESDLDIDVIINRKYDRDPYLTACEAIGAIPITFISQNLTQQELIMKHHGLGLLGARAFGKVLESNDTITKLDLTGNFMELGGKYFAKSLCFNRTITYLNLSNNDLKQAGSEIANMLVENNTIHTLILSHNGFGDQEMILFSESIKKNRSLKALDLSHNEIGDIGGLSLGQGIMQNDSLNEIDISWNEIRVRGMVGFFVSIKDHPELISLNVSHNGIGDVGNQLVAFFAKSNLVRLNIGYTRIGDSQFAAFLRGLEGNRSIQELDLSGNPLSAPSLQALFKCIPNTRINVIALKGIRFTKEISVFIEGLKKEAAFKINE